jgi:hypothetical protein
MLWAILAVGAVLVVGLVWMFLRSDRSDDDDVSSLEDGRARPAADGFFVTGFPAGSRIRWTANVSGARKNGVAEIAGAETFVYTGGTPSEITLQGLGAAPVHAPPPSSGPPSSNDDDSPFTGFPSAY